MKLKEFDLLQAAKQLRYGEFQRDFRSEDACMVGPVGMYILLDLIRIK